MFRSLIVFREHIFGHVVTESFLNFVFAQLKYTNKRGLVGLETVTEAFLCPSQSLDKGSNFFCTY